MERNQRVMCQHCKATLIMRNYKQHLHHNCPTIKACRSVTRKEKLKRYAPIKVVKKSNPKPPRPVAAKKRQKPQLNTQCSYCKDIVSVNAISEHRKTCEVKKAQPQGKRKSSRSGSKSRRQMTYKSRAYYNSFLSYE